MAYRRAYESLSLGQRKRYERFFGLNAQFRYETGASLQAARGHREREHITRRERNPLSLSSNDYRFLKKQAYRADIEDEGEANPLTAFYKTLTTNQRSLLRDRVAVEARRYKQRGSTKLPSRAGGNNKKGNIDYLSAYVDELRDDYPWFDDEMIGLAFYH